MRPDVGHAPVREAIVGDAARMGVPDTGPRLLRLLMSSTTFRYLVVQRLAGRTYRRHPRTVRSFLANRLLHRMTVKYGYELPIGAVIGPGLLIRHLGPIVVHRDVVMGRNVTLNTGVVIGAALRGPRKGVPTIGDGVYIGPGAKLIGKITIGDDVAIGANSVVTKDVDDHCVVAGIPAVVLSREGAGDYVRNPS